MSEIESYRTCLKCGQYKYIHVGSIPGLSVLFSKNILFSPVYYIHTQFLVTYFIHVHSSKYRIAVLHKHNFLAFLMAGSMNL